MITTCGGPVPRAPYSDLRVSIEAWLYISDYGLGHLDGAWGIHDLVTAQWVNDSDTTGPLDVEGTDRCLFYTDIRDTPYEWTVEHNYANGVRLVHMDMHTAKKRAPEFNLIPNNNGAAVIYGSEGWIYVSREGIVTNPPSLATEKIGPNQIQVTRSSDHHQNFLNAIRTGQQTICPWRSQCGPRRSLSRSMFRSAWGASCAGIRLLKSSSATPKPTGF